MSNVISFENLLTPISAELPAGVNLRQSAESTKFYYQIKDARLQARAIERNNAANNQFNNDANKFWQIVADFSSHVLAEKTKDLEIAAWLTEAWTRLQGFSGLDNSFKLLKGLIANFWDDIYPEIDEDGVSTKVAAITGLNGVDGNGSLLTPIQMIPLTQGQNPAPFALWNYQQAIELSQIKDAVVLKQKMADGAVSMDMLKSAAMQTSNEFFVQLIQAINSTITSFKELTDLLQQKAGTSAPPSSDIAQLLVNCSQCISFLTKGRVLTTQSQSPVASKDITTNQPMTNESLNKLNSRADAFALIQRVADYFRESEPLSPFAYSLDQIIRWGAMPLPALLAELIPDQKARNNFFLLTGIPPQSVVAENGS